MLVIDPDFDGRTGTGDLTALLAAYGSRAGANEPANHANAHPVAAWAGRIHRPTPGQSVYLAVAAHDSHAGAVAVRFRFSSPVWVNGHTRTDSATALIRPQSLDEGMSPMPYAAIGVSYDDREPVIEVHAEILCRGGTVHKVQAPSYIRNAPREIVYEASAGQTIDKILDDITPDVTAVALNGEHLAPSSRFRPIGTGRNGSRSLKWLGGTILLQSTHGTSIGSRQRFDGCTIRLVSDDAGSPFAQFAQEISFHDCTIDMGETSRRLGLSACEDVSLTGVQCMGGDRGPSIISRANTPSRYVHIHDLRVRNSGTALSITAADALVDRLDARGNANSERWPRSEHFQNITGYVPPKHRSVVVDNQLFRNCTAEDNGSATHGHNYTGFQLSMPRWRNVAHVGCRYVSRQSAQQVCFVTEGENLQLENVTAYGSDTEEKGLYFSDKNSHAKRRSKHLAIVNCDLGGISRGHGAQGPDEWDGDVVIGGNRVRHGDPTHRMTIPDRWTSPINGGVVFDELGRDVVRVAADASSPAALDGFDRSGVVAKEGE